MNRAAWNPTDKHAITGRGNRASFADTVTREVTSWEGVIARPGKFGVMEFRLGPHLLGALPLAGLVDERAVIERLRDAYEQAAAALDRRAGVLV